MPLSGDRWKRLEELFHAAMELPPDEREAYLDRACGDDTKLRREAASLITAGASSGPLEAAIAGSARSLIESGATAPGRRIGAYRVERELGHGGMGRVFLASRADDEYRKRVAIKLIRWGADDPEIRRRFLHERQILAGLEHPNIARLLDGGTTEDGRPYVVMDYVDGEAIDVYCDSHRLTTAERLQLFRRVCDAVHYAHSNLTIHRDLKPGNILVTEDGTPKLLDFGIAKLLADSPGRPETRTAVRLMTPEYASPEQVRAEPITTASDIYSLGVLLYELLTGHRPYQVKRETPAELERVICEEEPERPSTAVTREEELPPRNGGDPVKVTPDSVSRARRVSPDRLRRQLTGDLDTIVLMALRKEPGRRYASVDQLSEDLRRYLHGLPVLARADTFAYRAGKFVRRHRAGVATAAAVVVIVAGLTGLYLNRVARERDVARREAAKSEQVAGFLTSLFEVSDPAQSRGREVSARELLEQGAERVNRELAAQPEVQATMMSVIGRTYESLGLYDPALPLLERSLEIDRRLHGRESLETADALHDLGSLARKRGDLDAADSLFTAALDVRRALLPPDHAKIIQARNALALVVQERGDLPAADTLFRHIVEDARPLLRGDEKDRETFATVLSNHGRLLHLRGRLDAAESELRQALAIRRGLYGDEHPMVGMTMSNLAEVLVQEGDYEAADSIQRRLVDWGPRVLGEDHPNVTTWLNNRAALLKYEGRYAEAEKIQRRVLAAYRRRLGDEHPLVALALNNLANLRHDQGDFAAAESLHLQSLALSRKLYGDEHPQVADNLNNLAALYADEGKYARAIDYQRQALALDRKLLGEKHEYVALDHTNVGTFLLDDGRVAEAEPELRAGYEMALDVLGNDHPSTATAAYGLARLLARSGRYAAAEPLARSAVRIREEKFPADYWPTSLARTLLGEVLAGLGRFEEGETELRAGYDLLRAKRPEGDRYRAEGRARFVKLYTLWGRPERADSLPH